VPFYIRAGKCLPVTGTEVLVQLRRPPAVYAATPPPPNYFRFRLGPDMAIALGTLAKAPGEDMAGTPVELLASHHATADEMDAYERLLGDALKGDATHFAREDYVEQAWRIVDPVLGTAVPVSPYEPHTWGPRQAEQLLAADGGWHNPIIAT
jgi:glucose-6-phosphate 1-dehydrogenase